MSTTPTNDSILCLNGIRVLSMAWVVLGHTFLIGLTAMPLKFPKQALDAIGNPTYQFIVNAFFSVDSFFYLSGFLVCSSMLKKLEDLKVDGIYQFWRKFPLAQM